MTWQRALGLPAIGDAASGDKRRAAAALHYISFVPQLHLFRGAAGTRRASTVEEASGLPACRGGMETVHGQAAGGGRCLDCCRQAVRRL